MEAFSIARQIWRKVVPFDLFTKSTGPRSQSTHKINRPTQSIYSHNQLTHTINLLTQSTGPHNQSTHTINRPTQSIYSHNQSTHTINLLTQSTDPHNQSTHTITIWPPIKFMYTYLLLCVEAHLKRRGCERDLGQGSPHYLVLDCCHEWRVCHEHV